LYDATGGTPPYSGGPNNWKQCGGAALRDDPCSCGGRNCDKREGVCVKCANGDITAVILPSNGLDGTIPSSVGSMTGLNYMVLSHNNLKGTIPSSLASLTQLSSLELSWTYLEGTIPSSLASLTRLDCLDLSLNNLKGTIPSSLASLTRLTHLSLYWNALTGLVPPLPFKQYSSCALNYPGSCTEPNCNHFKCPLPVGSGMCTYGAAIAGVHCK
jgi:hypothetical protein